MELYNREKFWKMSVKFSTWFLNLLECIAQCDEAAFGHYRRQLCLFVAQIDQSAIIDIPFWDQTISMCLVHISTLSMAKYWTIPSLSRYATVIVLLFPVICFLLPAIGVKALEQSCSAYARYGNYQFNFRQSMLNSSINLIDFHKKLT